MSHLPEELRASVTLEIIGDGISAPALKAQAEKTGARIIFRERVPHAELLERMRKCTVYVQASELEGHPKTVLEAMACGAPVVVADSPGQGGVVRHGATGLKVPCDPLAFAHVLSQLIPDTDWRDILGGTAATTTQATFGLQVVSELEAAAHTRALLLSRCRGCMPGAARLSA